MFNLEAAVAHFEALNAGAAALRTKIISQMPQDNDDNHAVEVKLRRAWQRSARDVLLRNAPANHLVFIRRRLDRWEVPLLRGRRTERFLKLLQRLHSLVPPRVIAAVVRTNFNGWCTKRRFGLTGGCIFGCSGTDCIEHYSCCSAVHDFACKSFGLAPSGNRLADFLLLEAPPGRLQRDDMVLRALRTATVYIAHCRQCYSARAQPDGAALHQIAVEIVRGHPCANAMVRDRLR